MIPRSSRCIKSTIAKNNLTPTVTLTSCEGLFVALLQEASQRPPVRAYTAILTVLQAGCLWCETLPQAQKHGHVPPGGARQSFAAVLPRRLSHLARIYLLSPIEVRGDSPDGDLPIRAP
jgi:hypothetical protein